MKGLWVNVKDVDTNLTWV